MTNEAPRPVELGTARDELPYFAGRAEELSRLDRRLDRLCRTGDPTGGMSLIVGVPGVGKSLLGRKFAERSTARELPLDVRRLILDTSMLKSGVELFLAIGAALERTDEFRQVAEIDSRVTGRGAGLGPVKGNVTREHVRHTGSLSALLRNANAAGAWRGMALVLVVDELQTVDAAGMENLRILHEGAHGCPILLVGIGLRHTQRVLVNSSATEGVSRPGEVIHLQPLSACEAADAVSGNMRALGHEIPSPCVKALAAASHGFPQHIHGYLVGALDAVAKHGRLEEGPALQAALATGNQARIDYYQGRLSLLRGIQPMLALVEVMDKQDVDALAIEDATQALDDANFNGTAAIERAIAHGVLSEDLLGNVSFGIPSFHTYMIELRESGR